jgi:hypothetical protein
MAWPQKTVSPEKIRSNAAIYGFNGANIISIRRFLLRPLSFSLDASGR